MANDIDIVRSYINALGVIVRLYTDRTHFLYELLQNAEDALATRIRFVLKPDRFEVFHNGKPFTEADYKAIRDVGNSIKAEDINKIGEFGVGFKSVYVICSEVFLYSDPGHYKKECDPDTMPRFAKRIHEFYKSKDLEYEDLPGRFTTRFVFPYCVDKQYSGYNNTAELKKDISNRLMELGQKTLLFMKNLKAIEYSLETDGESYEGKYSLKKEAVKLKNDMVNNVSLQIVSPDSESEDETSYLHFSRPIPDGSGRTVDIAFPVEREGNGFQCIDEDNPYVYVYFPTGTRSDLNFIVQGPYGTTPDRSGIPINEDNQKLVKETARLLHDSLIILRDKGWLNMSFIKMLPLKKRYTGLFDLLYDSTNQMFRGEAIIPAQVPGKYVYADNAKLADGRALIRLLDDSKLTRLISNGISYRWLPEDVTKNNKEYDEVFRYFTNDLNIEAIEVSDLVRLIGQNEDFLKGMPDEWLVDLYKLFNNNPALFTRGRKENKNTLTKIKFIKSSTGYFYAPYKQIDPDCIHNLFLPPKNGQECDGIKTVKRELYEGCPEFFKDVLRIDEADDVDIRIRKIKRRWIQTEWDQSNSSQYIEDTAFLIEYYDAYPEVNEMLDKYLRIVCSDGTMQSPRARHIFTPVSSDGIDIEGYLRNLGLEHVFFLDLQLYERHGISVDMLKQFGVKDSVESYKGTVDLTLLYIDPVLSYVKANPEEPDAKVKSATIMKYLIKNKNTLEFKSTVCEMVIKLLTRQWVFTGSGVVSYSRDIYVDELDQEVYDLPLPRVVEKSLEFKEKTDQLTKILSDYESLSAEEKELLKAKLGIKEPAGTKQEKPAEDETFPTRPVRNWERIKLHAQDKYWSAASVRYVQKMRSVRESAIPGLKRSYLINLYGKQGESACQMCHEFKRKRESVQLLKVAEKELEPLNLNLCPDCAAEFRQRRYSDEFVNRICKQILELDEDAMQADEPVVISLDDDCELWFTGRHAAEIRELLKLADEDKEDAEESEEED
ncbi:MAG: hypothetical protein IK083_02915 [Abditibacteriota bacterium]|nr:hypothetical protein [Abditibacteriota bacterium]